MANILIIDDDEDVLLAAKLYLKQYVKRIDISSEPQKTIQNLKSDFYQIIFLDMNYTRNLTSGDEGFHYLEEIKKIDPSIEVILITAYGDVELAVKAIKEGATDFILKPWQNEKLLATVITAFNLSKTKGQVKKLQSEKEHLIQNMNKSFYNLIGNSPPMIEVFSMIKKVSKTDANILITGENGTGKELVSKAIHRDSNRNNEPFISVDMGAISETLFESELFGHKKGSFTDAREDRAGHFEISNNGTLFLDEIGNLSLPLQAKILRVLETREVKRLGANQTIPIDIRLICATNMDILEMVDAREFREDLLYRINTIEIKLPPLRSRGRDILLLAEIFIQEYCRKYKKIQKKLSNDTKGKLLSYYWPGNVRELRHSTERAIIMSENDTLFPDDFFFSNNSNKSPTPANDLNLDILEKSCILKALEKNNKNISSTSKELGLSRSALYRRIEKYNIIV